MSLSELARRAPPGWRVVNLCDLTGPLATAGNGAFYKLPLDVTEGTGAYLVNSEGLQAAATALLSPKASIRGLEACAADRLVYALLGESYGYSFPMISMFNDHAAHDSLIQPDHTDRSIDRMEEVIKMQLGGL